MIFAAGSILWRELKPFEIEVALVHRPQYDDWTFPKGKYELGESAQLAAYRETKEETGADSVFGPYIGKVKYGMGSEVKRVDYWSAKCEKNPPELLPNNEVDRVEWLSLKEARHFLTYEHDRDLLSKFKLSQRHTNVIVLLRHAKAIKRSEWQENENDRPLSSVGFQQAKFLKSQFSMYNLEDIHTSDTQRCISTIEEMKEELQIPMHIAQQLSEHSYEKDKSNSISYIKRLMEIGGNHLICSHNPVIPHIVEKLGIPKESKINPDNLVPGAAFVVHHKNGKVVAIHSFEMFMD